MTTKRQALSGRNPGNVAAAQVRSAAKRQCPACGRKSALRWHSDEEMFGWACRWQDCRHEIMTRRDQI